MGWWTLGLGCLWDGARNALAARYLSRSLLGWLILLAFGAAWGGLGWWALHGLAWYWTAALALGLCIVNEVAFRIYAIRELQQWQSYKAAEGWLRTHPKLRPMWERVQPGKYPPRIPD